MMQLYSYYLCDYTETEQKTRHVRYGRLAEIVHGKLREISFSCYVRLLRQKNGEEK